MAEHPTIQDVREMALTREIFFRILPRAVGDHAVAITANGANVTVGEGEVTITLGPQQVRKIALMEVPWCRVEFVAQRLTAEQFSAFSEKFHRHFQRGGG